LQLFAFANEEITMLQCYVLTCDRLVTAFLAPPRSQRPGQAPRSPHPKAGPESALRKHHQYTAELSYPDADYPDQFGQWDKFVENSTKLPCLEITDYRIQYSTV
jgi:hypothetical protein